MMRGRFITFEGGEGAGKSTQVRRLAEALKARGLPVEVTREPGGSTGAEVLRHIILSGAAEPFGGDAEAILFSAARADHLATRIVPALARGDWVISDRFADSTRVYQGVAGKVNQPFLIELERLTIGPYAPDLTLILDLPPKLGLARVSARAGIPDRFERQGMAFHNKLRQGFRALATAEPERCQIIDAAQTPELVATEIERLVVRRFALQAAKDPVA